MESEGLGKLFTKSADPLLPVLREESRGLDLATRADDYRANTESWVGPEMEMSPMSETAPVETVAPTAMAPVETAVDIPLPIEVMARIPDGRRQNSGGSSRTSSLRGSARKKRKTKTRKPRARSSSASSAMRVSSGNQTGARRFMASMRVAPEFRHFGGMPMTSAKWQDYEDELRGECKRLKCLQFMNGSVIAMLFLVFFVSCIVGGPDALGRIRAQSTLLLSVLVLMLIQASLKGRRAELKDAIESYKFFYLNEPIDVERARSADDATSTSTARKALKV